MPESQNKLSQWNFPDQESTVDSSKFIARKPTFDIITLGCKVNEYESAYYAEKLEELGAIPIENTRSQSADLVIVNTCTVTNTAASKSRQKIRRARRENPDAILAAVGCYVQTMEDEIRRDLQLDLLVGAAHKNELPKRIFSLFLEKQKQPLCELPSGEIDQTPTGFEEMPIHHFESQHRAFLKIQDGCNQFCSYCQIPYARGRERCLDFDHAVEIARKLAAAGHKEIVLTGIHTGRYHWQGKNLADLLEAMLRACDESVAFRISSIEITEVSDQLVELFRNNPRLMPHLHIPLQAGNNETLKRMHRPYTVEEFIERVEEIRKKIPQISVSTDLITGFVQESDREFENTLENLEKIHFSFLHIFPYSRRKGTAADAMDGFIDPAVQKERAAILANRNKDWRRKDMARFLHQSCDVLIEREDPHHPGYYLGYTPQYHPVQVASSVPLEGRVSVVLESIEPNDLYLAVVSNRKEKEGDCHAFIENV